MKRATVTALLACLGISAATAQKDLRDTVTTRDGRELRGRVLERFHPDEVVLVQGGKRIRVPRRDVTRIRTVVDELRTFFAHRSATDGDQVGRAWLLVEWAEHHRLPAMARLQAMHVALLQPDHQPAHEYLGHRRSRDGTWLWPRRSQWLSLRDYERRTAKFGTPKEITAEHFRVRSNASLRRTIDALFDLERFYVVFQDEVGEALAMREVLDPMDFHLRKSAVDFPAFTALGYPYYLPHPNGDTAYTYFATDAGRPELLFQLATEHLLYNALAQGVTAALASPRDRLVAWVDIGLGQHFERRMQGAAGRAEPIDAWADRGHASALLKGLPYSLPNLLGVRYGRFQDPTRDTPLHWAYASSLVAFLLDEQVDKDRPARFLEFVRQAYGLGKGSSSSVLDKALGLEIEALEAPFSRWLEAVVSAPPGGR